MAGGAPFDLTLVGHLTRDHLRDGQAERQAPGGAVLYGALAARASGARVQVLTRLAPADAALTEALSAAGVAVTWWPSAATTTIAISAKTADGERRRFAVHARGEPFTAAQLACAAAPVVLVCPLMHGELPEALLAELAGRASLALDVQGFVRRYADGALVSGGWPAAARVLAGVHTVKADRRELELLTGDADLLSAARRLAAWGPREIVATDQGQILLWAEGRAWRVAVPPGPPAGRTGRGDTTIAAYLARRRVAEPPEARRFAAAVLAIKLERAGPFAGATGEVDARLARVAVEAVDG